MRKKQYRHLYKDENIGRMIKDVVRAINTVEFPAELDTYRRIIRQRVSVFRRGYFAAYLLKLCVGKNIPRARHSREPERSAEGFQSVFVGIGRNQRVSQDDMRNILTKNANIDAKYIGQIKILDRFSFIDIVADQAGKVIAELNTVTFRGRKLRAEYAKSRPD